MKLISIRTIVTTSLLLGFAALSTNTAVAQTPAEGKGLTRAQVKMDRDTFLAMARWDELSNNWVLKADMPMPAGVPTRAEVMAMRDKFFSMHKWDETTSQYVPVKGAPRDMSKLTRAEVEAETVRFFKMYRFDESTSQWIAKSR